MARNTHTDSSNSDSGVGSGVGRRTVLQALGATGVAGTVMGTASADSDDGDGGSEAPSRCVNEPAERIPTSSQFWSFLHLTTPGPSHTDGVRVASNPQEEAERYPNDTTGYSYADLIRLSAGVGLDSYEPDQLDDEQAMLEAQRETGCYMSSAHVSTSDVESDPAGMAETYGQFAVDGHEPRLVEPSIQNGWDSEEGARENARRINAAADLMADHGFQFGYHNHYWEFQYLDEEAGLRAYDVFIEEIEDHVYLQLDVAWAYAGVDRADPIHYITEYGDKIGSLHMKNWAADRYEGTADVERFDALTEIHKGDLDMHEIADAARNHSKVDHLVYEHDLTPHPYHSFEYANLVLDWVNETCNPTPVRGREN